MSFLDDTFHRLLKGEALSAEQARAAMLEVMTGEFSPVKLAGWLTALRMKGETAEEIAGCATAMREKAIPVCPLAKDVVDLVGTGGDRSGTVNISTAAALVAAAAGVSVAKHGNRAVSSKCGSADVLAALGVRIDLSPGEMEKCLEQCGFTFLFAPTMHPAMRHAAQVRKELGVRTVFNILGPLCNPAGARRAVIGVYERHLCEIMAKAASRLGAERLLVVHGEDGLDEISISGPTWICELKAGDLYQYEFHPTAYGVPTASLEQVRGGGPELNATLLVETFSGRKGPIRDIIVLNAAAALVVADKAADWPSAIKMASWSVDSGAAMRKLDEVRAFTQGNFK